jgi:hypothetical protein
VIVFEFELFDTHIRILTSRSAGKCGWCA